MSKEDVTINDVLRDDLFKIEVSKALRFIVEKRRSRPAAKEGFRYKRDWYHRMFAKNQLTERFFLENIGDIWLKKSNLNSETRGIIKYVCQMALIKWQKAKDLNKSINQNQ